MEKFSLIIVLLMSMLAAVSCDKSEADKTVSTSDIKNQVIVYYFHTDRRCETCFKIEDTAKDVVSGQFADAAKSGKLSFEPINIDKQENLDLAIKFEAAGSKLCIANYDTNGKLTIDDLTDYAFTNAFSDNKLAERLKVAIEKSLTKDSE